MNLHSLLGEAAWWWALPLLVFLARVCDVSLGTLRVMFVSRGLKRLAPLVGFFEVLIWITAIAHIIRDLDNVLFYFAYAGGYALGTYVGLLIEERLAMGMVAVRIITQKEADELAVELPRHGFGITCVDAQGRFGRVKIVFTIIRRRDLPRVLQIVRRFNPTAFYAIEDIRTVGRETAVPSFAVRDEAVSPPAAPIPARLGKTHEEAEQRLLGV